MALRQWVDERLSLSAALRGVLDKPVPPHVDPLRHYSAFLYCFGGIAFLLVMLQFLTGVLLAVYYVPAPETAYYSILFIENEVRFGWLIRGMHRWGAYLLVIFVGLHMLRVYLHGAYKKPRELNWVVGAFLLLMVLAFGFTGYLLPWDQKAYWATMVGTTMPQYVPGIGHFLVRVLRGGEDLGALTLTRFFVTHMLLLPGIVVVLLAAHFFMVRRQGISGPL